MNNLAYTYNVACWIKISAEDCSKQFSYLFKKIGFDISCKLSPEETVCMKCQSLFSGKKWEKYRNFLSPELAEKGVKF